jgi:chromosome segregation ATPase
MNTNDDLKKRLERLTNNPTSDSPTPSDSNDPITVEKLTQVLTETRRNIREDRKRIQQEISELQSKLESAQKQLRYQETRIRDLSDEVSDLKDASQQHSEIITQAIPRRRGFWPFGKGQSC